MALYGGVEIPNQPDLDNVLRLDLLAVPCVREMQQYGMAIDIPHLEALTDKLSKEASELRYEICSYIPAELLDEFIEQSNMDAEDDYLPMNVESNVQMRKLLFKVLGIGAGKNLKLTKSGDISTGKKQLETHKKDHPVIRPVLKYRECSKLINTYTSKLPRLSKFHPESVLGRLCWCGLKHRADTYRAHTNIMMTRTSTGRFASAKPFNLQNIPARTKYGKETRRGFVGSPGTKIVGCDFGQLQLRIFADRANASKMIWIFENDKDPHTMTAAWSFGIDETQVSKEQRDPSKNVNFAILFRESPPSVLDQLISDSYGRNEIDVPDWLNQAWVNEFFRKWHGMYPEAEQYMKRQDYRSMRYGVVWDLFGRIRRIPEVRSAHKRIVMAGLRQAGNHPIQAPDSGMMRLVMAEVRDTLLLMLRQEGIWAWPLMTIHDELLIEVDEEYAEFAKVAMESVFENVMNDRVTGERRFRVPVGASGKVSDRWEK